MIEEAWKGRVGEEFGESRGLDIEIRGESLGEDVNRSKSLIAVGFTYIAILD